MRPGIIFSLDELMSNDTTCAEQQNNTISLKEAIASISRLYEDTEIPVNIERDILNKMLSPSFMPPQACAFKGIPAYPEYIPGIEPRRLLAFASVFNVITQPFVIAST